MRLRIHKKKFYLTTLDSELRKRAKMLWVFEDKIRQYRTIIVQQLYLWGRESV